MSNAADKPYELLLSDRDLLVAIFNAVSVLARELTGKRLSVVCHTDSGDRTIYGDPTSRLILDSPEAS